MEVRLAAPVVQEAREDHRVALAGQAALRVVVAVVEECCATKESFLSKINSVAIVR